MSVVGMACYSPQSCEPIRTLGAFLLIVRTSLSVLANEDFWGDELQARSAMEDCDFFSEVPPGCRAYLMKSVIHDWNDEDAQRILGNCRKVTPTNGALLLIEWDLSEANLPSRGKVADVMMMVLTGGKERTIEEYRTLLGLAGFGLNKVISTEAELNIIEALPV